jgi:hypothetical protein
MVNIKFIKFKNIKIINIFIFIFIFLFAYIINVANIIFGNVGANHGELIQGATLSSPDNFWYISQIKNYLSGFGFTSNPSDLLQTARRTPGYPLFYALHYLIFGEYYAHRIITISQCLIFALSAITLGTIVSSLTKNIKIGQIAAIIYGTSPYLASFLFMTITEAISPEFVIFSLYLYFKALNNNKLSYYVLTGIMVAVATLIRPTNGILLISYGIGIIFTVVKLLDAGKYIISILLGFLFLITPWTLRNYSLTGLFIPLETFRIQIPYDGQGLKSNGLNSWHKSWAAHDMLRLHYGMKNDLNLNEKYNTIDKFIQKEVPAFVYVGYDKLELRKLFIDYQNCIELDLKRNNGKTLVWGEKINDCEFDINERFLQYEKNIKNEYPLYSNLFVPLFYRGSKYIFHSGMHTFKSLQTDNIGSIGYIFKTFAYIINVSLWILFLIFLIYNYDIRLKLIAGSFVLISFLFITYNYQVEGRYLLSCYPFMYISSIVVVYKAFGKASKIIRK